MKIADLRESTCPGCGLWMPSSDTAINQSYYNSSAECWDLYTEVLGEEYNNAVLAGQVQQLTVDAYAVQHAGGPHPDNSVGIHLSGLYLMFEKGVRPPYVPPILHRLATNLRVWPHFPPPDQKGGLTICDVAMCSSAQDHIRIVREWAQSVWVSWTQYHSELASIISNHISL